MNNYNFFKVFSSLTSLITRGLLKLTHRSFGVSCALVWGRWAVSTQLDPLLITYPNLIRVWHWGKADLNIWGWLLLGFFPSYERMFESRWGWASSAAPLPHSSPGRPTVSFYSEAGPVAEGSFSGNLRCFKWPWSDAKNVQCLLKLPSSSCLFLFLNVLSTYDKYFFKPLLDRGLNPRARDEKEIWVKPCKYYAFQSEHKNQRRDTVWLIRP